VIKRLVLVGVCGAFSCVANVGAQVLPEATTVSTSSQPSAAVEQADNRVARDARRFGVGVQGGVGIDPEIIDFGAHATFGPVFKPNLAFRPGLEIGAGEVTTFLGVNLDFIYELRGNSTNEEWLPYVGVGPTFGLSHRGFAVDADDIDHVDVDDVDGTPTSGWWPAITSNPLLHGQGAGRFQSGLCRRDSYLASGPADLSGP
jgi:hypothetical protein